MVLSGKSKSRFPFEFLQYYMQKIGSSAAVAPNSAPITQAPMMHQTPVGTDLNFISLPLLLMLISVAAVSVKDYTSV